MKQEGQKRKKMNKLQIFQIFFDMTIRYDIGEVEFIFSGRLIRDSKGLFFKINSSVKSK